MPRTSAARDKVLQVATERLAALVGSREIVAQEAADPEPKRLLIDASPQAFRPILRIALAVCILVGLMMWLNRPQAVTPVDLQSAGVAVNQPSANSSDQTLGDTGLSTQPASRIVIDVEGHVRHPGLVTLSADSRVADAISEAGGLTRRLEPGVLNLAQKVTDGQLILVGSGSVQGSSQASSGGSAGSPASLININTSSETDLDALPGVGPVMSARIVAWRTENGGFKTVDDLQQVPGIGPKVFANLKPLVCN